MRLSLLKTSRDGTCETAHPMMKGTPSAHEMRATLPTSEDHRFRRAKSAPLPSTSSHQSNERRTEVSGRCSDQAMHMLCHQTSHLPRSAGDRHPLLGSKSFRRMPHGVASRASDAKSDAEPTRPAPTTVMPLRQCPASVRAAWLVRRQPVRRPSALQLVLASGFDGASPSRQTLSVCHADSAARRGSWLEQPSPLLSATIPEWSPMRLKTLAQLVSFRAARAS